MQQIEDKGYVRKFSDDKRKVFMIAIRFSTESRSIDSWIVSD